jgi:hypothetical protein
MKKLLLVSLFLIGIISLSFSQLQIQTNEGWKKINNVAYNYNSIDILPIFNTPATFQKGITLPGGSSYLPLKLGIKSNTAGDGLVLVGSTDNTGGVQLFTDDGGATLGSITSPIWARYLITKTDQSSGATATGAYFQTKTLTGMTMTGGSYTALKAFTQVGGTLVLNGTLAEAGIINAGISFEGNLTNTLGTLSGVDININDGTHTIGTSSGLIIRKVAASTLGWTNGIKIADAGAVTGIDIGTCTTALTAVSPVLVTVANAGTTGWMRSIYGTATASGSAMTSGYGAAGVRGLVNVTGTATGQAYFYGTQGKLIPSAAAVLAGGSFYAALAAQLDVTAASTYTSVGGFDGLWVDAGATAGTNAIAAAPTMINMIHVTNTAVGLLPESVIKVQAYATNFLSLKSGGGDIAGWLTTGGTSCTSSGSTAPYATIGVMVGTQQCYIRVWSAK